MQPFPVITNQEMLLSPRPSLGHHNRLIFTNEQPIEGRRRRGERVQNHVDDMSGTCLFPRGLFFESSSLPQIVHTRTLVSTPDFVQAASGQHLKVWSTYVVRTGEQSSIADIDFVVSGFLLCFRV